MDWSGRKVLVTGAGGFIGSHLVSALVERGARVRAMVRYNSRNDIGQLRALGDDALRQLQIDRGDIRDARFVRTAVENQEVVFHLAALITIPYSYVAPASYFETNLTGTLNVLEAMRELGTPRFVHTSTSEVYGSALFAPMDETHPLQAQSPYSASKIAADKLVESYVRSFAVPAVTVRPFNTYGPRQTPRAILPSIIMQALGGSEIRVGSLDPVRDLTFVKDTVEGFLAAGSASGVEGETLNLGTGQGYSVRDLVDTVQRLAGTSAPVVVDEARIRPAASEVARLVSSSARAREKLGWASRVSLEQGLERTIDWFRSSSSYYDASNYNI